MRALAEVHRVRVTYGTGHSAVHALRDVSFTAGAGDAVALWGRSGSGKTTLLHLLGGLVEPSAGAVYWRGEPLASLDAAARGRVRRQGLAYVFQGSNLLPYFSAYENVAFAMENVRTVHRPDELLELVGLGAKLDALPSELSGGEAQRVAIARALGQQPELLLCDEPTGQLDSATGARVLDLIDALRAEFGFALVVATHDADVAARYSRTVQLADGAVVPDEVVA
jgi:putative ABC transport system ATP-binding protein